jgi:hypothetical protein
MSFGWEDVGDTESGWRYGIITGTGTLTELDVYNLLSDSTISSEIISNAGQGNQFGIKVVGYTEFGDRVFAGNYTSIQYLSKLILDNNLTTLGTSLFEGSGIDSITIPSSVTTIQNPSSVFVGLSKIYVDSDNPNYSSGIIKAGGYDYDGILYNEDGNELITYPSGAPMSTITIPEGVTKIGNAAFYSNSSVKTITLASTITELGDYAFEECYMLDEVYGLRSSMTIGSNVFRYTGVKEAFDLAKTISDRSQTTDETNGISISYDPSSQKSQDTTTQTYDVVTTVTKVSNVEYNFGYSTRTGVNTTVTWIWEETVEALGNRDLTGSVTISGTATQGEVLTAITTSLADADGLGTFSYQWKRDGTAISDATSSTYTLTQDDVGKTITVTVSYTDQRGFAESVTSAATSAVANVNDSPTIEYSTDNIGEKDVTIQDLEKNRAQVNVTNYGDAKNDSFKYQWQRSEFKENDNDLVWSNIDNAINEVYTFENSDAKHVFRAVVDFIYNDENGTTGSKTLLRIDYFPTEWTDESKQDKTATLGEDYSYKPVAKELSPSEMYYLLESPDWLDFESSEGKNKSDIPYSDYPLLVGTPTVAGTYNVQIAVVDDGEIYRASVLTFDITVPFKPATTDALQTAIDKWYELANNENDTTANNYEGPEYFGNPKHWDTSLITDLSYVFFKKDQTNHPDISEWDVSNVTSMQGTFSNSTFNGELNKWNVASVTDFSFTFANNIVFNKPLFRWNVQDATTMESMFDNAYSFNQTIEPPMMQNKDGTDFPTELTWDETTINGYLETIYGSATSQTNPTTFNGVFGMIALLKKTYLDNIPEDPNEVGKYNTIKSSFSEVMSELITIQQEILKYNYTYDETDGWTKTSPSIYFTNTDGKTGDEEDDAKNKLNQLRLNTIVDGMLLINKAYDIAKGLGADYSDLISEMKRIYDHVYANLPFYVAWYAPLLTTKANFLNNALTFHNGATDGNIEKKLTDFIATKPKPIKSINDIDYNNTQKQYIVNFSSADLFDNFKAAYTSYSE